MNIEKLVLSHLISNESFSRKVFPFIKKEYFSKQSNQVLFELLSEYLVQYNAYPTKEALLIDLSNKDGINENLYKESKDSILDLVTDESTDEKWLIDKTEEFCKERALHNALLAAIKIIDNKDGNITKGNIPKLMIDALGVSFDTMVGHDFLEDWEARYDFYHKKEERIPFDIELLNEITDGGLPRKTLTCFLSVTGGGKTRAMCSFAAANLKDGKNVLYITLEMAEEKIAERIEANLIDVDIKNLKNLEKPVFGSKISKLKEKTNGKLIIKEYPTAAAGSAHFRHLLNELRLKKKFSPDIIYIDYLGICSSARLKKSSVNSYEYMKSVSEELRGLAIEFNVPVVSGIQVNRGGYGNSDIEMENVSESMGIAYTLDLFLGLVVTEELDNLNQVMIKQLKNRLGDPNINKRFCIGVDRAKMRLYNLENPTEDLVDDKPLMSKTTFGSRDEKESSFDIAKFKDFK